MGETRADLLSPLCPLLLSCPLLPFLLFDALSPYLVWRTGPLLRHCQRRYVTLSALVASTSATDPAPFFRFETGGSTTNVVGRAVTDPLSA
jgi:hypothetical protein